MTSGTSYSPPPAFGRFRLLHQIGAGVLGPVFRTHDPEADRLVAVKAFALDITPEQANVLSRELQRLADLGLDHPRIAAPIATGVEEFVAYLAIQYVAGESLDAAIRQYGPAPPGDAIRLVFHIADALDAAARLGVFHGSLHPRDILVTPGETHVTGFGLAKALERIGLHGPIRRPYVAPERESGDDWGAAADVFSLAAIAYEVLTGRRALPGTEHPLPGLADIHAHDPAALREAIEAGLDPDPEHRPAHAVDFANAFAAAMAEGEAGTGPAERAGSHRQRRQRARPPKLPGLDEPLAPGRTVPVTAAPPQPVLTTEPAQHSAPASATPAPEPVEPPVAISAVAGPVAAAGVPLEPPAQAVEADEAAVAAAPEPEPEARVRELSYEPLIDEVPADGPSIQAQPVDVEVPEAVPPLPEGEPIEPVEPINKPLESIKPLEPAQAAPVAAEPVAPEPSAPAPLAAGLLVPDLAVPDAPAAEVPPPVRLRRRTARRVTGPPPVVETAEIFASEFDASRPSAEPMLEPGAVESGPPQPVVAEALVAELPAIVAVGGEAAPASHATGERELHDASLAFEVPEPEPERRLPPVQAVDDLPDDASGFGGVQLAARPEPLELASAGFTPDLEGLADELARAEPPPRRPRVPRAAEIDDLRDPGTLAGEPPVPRALDALALSTEGRASRSFAPAALPSTRPRLALIGLGIAAGVLIGLVAGYLLWMSPKGGPAKVPAVQPTAVDVAPAPPVPARPAPVAAVPPRPAAAATGVIEVRSTPSNADVFVNGTRHGVTPGNLREWPFGTYTVRVTRPGYLPQERVVTLDAGQATLRVEFTLTRRAAKAAPGPAPAARGAKPAPKPAPPAGGSASAPTAVVVATSISIETRPPGASVRLDGKDVGVTPITLSPVKPGPHTVELLRSGYRTWSTTVTVAAGTRQRITASLERNTPR